jgi:TRAP transporter TAXI family solute receptor
MPGQVSRRSIMMVLGSWPLVSTLPSRAQERVRLVFATAGEGSAFLAFGQAAKPVIERYAPVTIDLRQTGGTNENAELLQAGEAQLGCLSMGPGYDAWNGRGPFQGRPLRALRAVAPLYETAYHSIALAGSGIRTLKELSGRHVGVGPAGGPGEVFFRGIAEALAIKATVATGTPADLSAKILAREIDAFWYGSGLPSPPFADIARQAEAVVFGFQRDEAQLFRRRFPTFTPHEIPAGTYPGQTEPISSLATWNFIATHAGVVDEALYGVTKALLDRPDEVRAAFPTAAAMTRANAVANTFLPFHAGAARYYRETGVILPPALLSG